VSSSVVGLVATFAAGQIARHRLRGCEWLAATAALAFPATAAAEAAPVEFVESVAEVALGGEAVSLVFVQADAGLRSLSARQRVVAQVRRELRRRQVWRTVVSRQVQIAEQEAQPSSIGHLDS
jgi:hypothetical protein